MTHWKRPGLPNSIRSRLTVTFVSLVLGPLLVAGGVLAWQSFTVQQRQAFALQNEIAGRVAAQVQDQIAGWEHELDSITKLQDLDRLDSQERDLLLSRLQTYQGTIEELVLLDSSGRELVHKSRLRVITPADLSSRAGKDEFEVPAATGQPYYSSVRFDQASSEWLMTIAVPFTDTRTGLLAGVLLADVRFSRIWALLGAIPVDNGESVYMVDAHNQVVAHQNPSVVQRGTWLPVPPTDGIHAGLSGATVVMVVSRLPFGQQEFSVVAEQPVSQALALGINTLLVTGLVLLAGLVVAGGLGLVAVRAFVVPIQVLANVAHAIRSGDLTQQAQTVGLLELDELARSFNSMTAQLQGTLADLQQRIVERQQAEQALIEERKTLRTLLDNLPDYVYVKDLNGQVLIDNRAHMLALGGAQRDNAVGPTPAGVLPVDPVALTSDDEQIIAGHEELIEREEEQMDPAGPGRWFSTVTAPLRDSHSHVVGLVGMRREVTERKRREAAERSLEDHRQSPIGRAEAVAQELLAHPETALVDLHDLADKAGHDLAIAALLEPLPRVLEDRGAPVLSGLASGYHYIAASLYAPELLNVGLRLLITHLAQTGGEPLRGASQAAHLYHICQQALQASSVSQITELLTDLAPPPANVDPANPLLAANDSFDPVLTPDFLANLAGALGTLATPAEALHAYERVDTLGDKLVYLVSAIEGLRHAEHQARIGLGGADGPIVQRLTENWLGIVTNATSELQTRSQLSCQLLTRRAWHGESVALVLNLHNAGPGAALNIRLSLAPALEYTVLDDQVRVERLGVGEEAQVELRVRPRLAPQVTQLRARFTVLYDDPRGPDNIDNFADVVDLMTAADEFHFIRNPYVVGTPLQPGSPLFFGREDVFRFIRENLSAAHRNNLVLIGQRRTGKTSVLRQLPVRLGEEYVPVYLDGQNLALDQGLPSFFLNLASEITFALEKRGFQLAPLTAADFAENPPGVFERRFLADVRQNIGQRHLLLLLDEFEELEAAVRRGRLDDSIFGFLRHLMQHAEGLSVIFCGTHRMEELAADYWSVLFNISLYRHVGYLEQAEAIRLIQEPVAGYAMHYDDLALDKMWRVTAGHPFFLQLLCHSLVNWHNRSKHSYVTVSDVNAAISDILATGEAHLVYLWAEASQVERLVLTALSRIVPHTGQASPVLVGDYLAERGIKLERQVVSEALHRLALRDTLRVNVHADDGAEPGRGADYGWRLGLLGLWVEKYKSLSRVVDEVPGR